MTTTLIIPAFNCEKWLSETLEHVLAQTVPFAEIIVVDDGSTDGTAEAARRFESQIKVIRQENHGLSGARNAAILASGSELVMLCDADDLLLPRCHESRLATLNRSPSSGLVAGGHRYIDESGAVIQEAGESVPFDDAAFSQILRGDRWPNPGWLIRREVFDVCGLFDPMLRSCEDWEFLLRVATRFPLAFDDEIGVSVRILPGSLSSNYLRMLDTGAAAIRKVRAYAPPGSGYGWNRYRGFAFHLRGVLYRMLRRDPGNGWTRLIALLVRRPGLAAYFPYIACGLVAKRVAPR